MGILHRSAPAVLTAGLAATALLLGGCAATDAEGPEAPVTEAQTLEELYDAAIEAGEDTVLIYGPGEGPFAPVYAEFMERFDGIEVVTEFMFGGDLNARLEQEQATQQYAGDLVHLDDVVRYVDMMQSWVPAGVEVPAEVVLFGDKLYTASQSPYVFAYNADKFSAEEVPSSWAEIVEFDGKIGMSDPTSLAATASALYSAYSAGAVDEDWFAALAALEPTIYQSSSQMVAAIPTGEIDFTPVAYFGFVLGQQANGANVQAVVPSDGVFLPDSPYGLLNGAPHPNAAKLLVSWLLSDEGQASIAKNVSEYATMPGSPAPTGLPAKSELSVFPSQPGDKRIAFKEEGVAFLGTWF